MGIREKILILLMAGVIGYGVFDFTMTKIRKSSMNNRVSEVRAEVEQLESTTKGQVDAAALAPREVELLGRLLIPWTKDLFVETLYAPAKVDEPEVPTNAAGELVMPEPKYRYTGYLNIDGKMIAMINGSDFQVGDLLNDKLYRVETIDAESVALKRETGSGTLQLKILKPDSIIIPGKRDS